MRSLSSFGQSLAWIAVSTMCLPVHGAFAESDARPALTPAEGAAVPIIDVALAEHGRLIGRVLNAELRPEAGAEVAIHADGQTVAVTRANAAGVFAVAGLRGGVHQVSTANVAHTYRFWAPGTAPPSAAPSVAVISDPDIVRGQWGPPPMANDFVSTAKVWATNPFVIGGVVAAAVAIPVAIHNARRDRRPAS